MNDVTSAAHPNNRYFWILRIYNALHWPQIHRVCKAAHIRPVYSYLKPLVNKVCLWLQAAESDSVLAIQSYCNFLVSGFQTFHSLWPKQTIKHQSGIGKTWTPTCLSLSSRQNQMDNGYQWSICSQDFFFFQELTQTLKHTHPFKYYMNRPNTDSLFGTLVKRKLFGIEHKFCPHIMKNFRRKGTWLLAQPVSMFFTAVTMSTDI